MSVGYASTRNINNKTLSSNNTEQMVWKRPANWLPMPNISNDNKLIGLFRINKAGNYVALTCSGAYTVDWGDGTVDNIATGVTAQHQYDYTTYDTSNTTLVSDESGTFKQAFITITPQSGQTLTSINLHVRHSAVSVSYVSLGVGWMDIVLNIPSLTSFTVGNSTVAISLYYLEQITILDNSISSISSGAIVSGYCKSLYIKHLNNCSSIFWPLLGANTLEYIYIGPIPKLTTLDNFFRGCGSLKYIRLPDTSNITNMTGMFYQCTSLKTIPLFNTSKVTNMSNMFYGCTLLQTIPLLNTSTVTNMSSMFQGCSSLRTIPLLNTSNVTTMTSMFQQSYLHLIPLFNTSKVTDMASMFQQCSKLLTIPLLNTSNVTTMAAMFSSCSSLRTIPLLNTSNVTNMSSMFSNCTLLQSIPAIDASKTTTVANMFYGTANTYGALTSIPALNLISNTVALSSFNQAGSTTTIDIYNVKYTTVINGIFTVTEIEKMLNNLLPVSTAQTFSFANTIVSGASATLSSNTTLGSTTITMASTTGITVGMQVTGTGTPLTTAIAVTFQDTSDTVTLNSHGLSNGDIVSFATIVTTTGITVGTPYYVINSTTNTFQVSTSSGGSVVALTTNGTGTMRYNSLVTAIVPNTSVTMSRPMTSTASASSLVFRVLNTSIGILKGWTVSG